MRYSGLSVRKGLAGRPSRLYRFASALALLDAVLLAELLAAKDTRVANLQDELTSSLIKLANTLPKTEENTDFVSFDFHPLVNRAAGHDFLF